MFDILGKCIMKYKVECAARLLHVEVSELRSQAWCTEGLIGRGWEVWGRACRGIDVLLGVSAVTVRSTRSSTKLLRALAESLARTATHLTIIRYSTVRYCTKRRNMQPGTVPESTIHNPQSTELRTCSRPLPHYNWKCTVKTC